MSNFTAGVDTPNFEVRRAIRMADVVWHFSRERLRPTLSQPNATDEGSLWRQRLHRTADPIRSSPPRSAARWRGHVEEGREVSCGV